MLRPLLLSLLLFVGGCGMFWEPPATLPPVGWSNNAKTICKGHHGIDGYGAQALSEYGLTFCIYASRDQLYGEVWTREGPVEGKDPWGLDVRGWYDGGRVGRWQFSDGGVVRAEGRFHGGRVGHWTISYPSGTVASEVEWDAISLREGPAQFWYPDRKPWWSGQYHEGHAVGTWRHCDRAGHCRDVDATQHAVGPLAEPREYRAGEDECGYENLAWGADELAARDDVRITSDGHATTYTFADGRVLGTLAADTNYGTLTDENGVVIMHSDPDDLDACYDEGGRRISADGGGGWFNGLEWHPVGG